MRDIVSSMYPSVLNMGIASALEWLAESFRASSGMHVEVHVDDDIGKLDEVSTIPVFKIAQFALSNVSRHAEAQNLFITLEIHGDNYRLEIRDDGKGFDLDRSRRESLGMVAMEELSNTLGGEIVFLSAPGKGTVVEVCFPRVGAMQPTLFDTV
jgi:signal transduction histidine kinase